MEGPHVAEMNMLLIRVWRLGTMIGSNYKGSNWSGTPAAEHPIEDGWVSPWGGRAANKLWLGRIAVISWKARGFVYPWACQQWWEEKAGEQDPGMREMLGKESVGAEARKSTAHTAFMIWKGTKESLKPWVRNSFLLGQTSIAGILQSQAQQWE